jgi:hypothetical protein
MGKTTCNICHKQFWSLGLASHRAMHYRAIKENILSNKPLLPCTVCGGDGKETCDNPDHGFITAMSCDGFEIGRLGCPVCGHSEDHKVPNGGKCEHCNGTGIEPIKKIT